MVDACVLKFLIHLIPAKTCY